MGLARNLARLLPNSSGQLPTANLQDSAITSAKIADATVSDGDLYSILDLSGKTLTLPSSSVREYQLIENGTSTNRTLNGDSGWVDHLSATFTTNQACTVFCHAQFSHGYEEGIVSLHGRFILDGGTTTSELQVFKQGFSSNFSFGAHNCHGFFTSVSAGSHTIKFQARNYAGGTYCIMNYFDNYNAGDRMFILYK